MSPVGYLLLLLVAVCGLTAAQRSAHVAPSLEEREAMRRGPCQINWTLSDSEDRCFRLMPAAAAWSQARSRCSQLQPAARLASANSSDDRQLLRALWREAIRLMPALLSEEAALWIDPAAAQLRGVVEAGAGTPESMESVCPSLATEQASARQVGYGCSQRLLYVCELDTADLNTAEE